MKQNSTLIALVLIALSVVIVYAQEYTNPALSPKDIADWANSGGFIASGTGDPSITEDIATGSLYVDNTDADYPKLWRFNGDAWAPLSGDSESLVNHLASDTDPHGSNMKVSESMQVGDPEKTPWSYIDSPSAGQVRIASYITLLELDDPPAANATGSIYYDSDGHFYGYDGSIWEELGAGGSGVTSHSALSELDYASSGHTGFAASADIPVNSDFTLNGLSEKSYTNLTDKPSIPVNSDFTLNGLSEKSFTSLTNKPTTLSGYGITDAVAAKSIISVASSRALALTDAGNLLTLDNSSPMTITIPLNSTIPVGKDIEVMLNSTTEYGYISPAAGVTIRSPLGYNLYGYYAKATITKIAANVWVLSGNLDYEGIDFGTTYIDVSGAGTTAANGRYTWTPDSSAVGGGYWLNSSTSYVIYRNDDSYGWTLRNDALSLLYEQDTWASKDKLPYDNWTLVNGASPAPSFAIGL
jgi:hypothetical protein